MSCWICLSYNAPDCFATGRVAICSNCIQAINNTRFSLEDALILIDQYLGRRLKRWDSATLKDASVERWKIDKAIQRRSNKEEFDAYFLTKRDGWRKELASQSLKQLSTLEREAVKVYRASTHNLLCADHEFGDSYPADWQYRTKEVRRLDENRCRRCGSTWEAGVTDLHVHHIIHRINNGSHHFNNLVTLCNKCHGWEHGRQFPAVARAPDDVLSPLAKPPSLVATPQNLAQPSPSGDLQQAQASHSEGTFARIWRYLRSL